MNISACGLFPLFEAARDLNSRQVSKFPEQYCSISPRSVPSNKSSQPTPADQRSCNSIFALTVNGAMKPSGSNSVAMFLRKPLFVLMSLTSGMALRNEKISSFGNHSTPNVFTDGSSFASRSIPQPDSRAWVFLSAPVDRLTATFEHAYLPSAIAKRVACKVLFHQRRLVQSPCCHPCKCCGVWSLLPTDICSGGVSPKTLRYRVFGLAWCFDTNCARNGEQLTPKTRRLN